MKGAFMMSNMDKKILRFNLKKNNRFACNCGGYALRTWGWYIPWYFIDDECYYDKYCDKSFHGNELQNLIECVHNEVVEGMLREFSNSSLRVISKIEDALPNEEVLCFRLNLGISYEAYKYYIQNPDESFIYDEQAYLSSDFHFKVFRYNRWIEKSGCSMVKPSKTIFNEVWNDGAIDYYGPITLCTKNKKECLRMR